MAKVPINSFLLLSRRRAYTVAAEKVMRAQPVMKKVPESTNFLEKRAPPTVEKDTFWMRDPKTGNWIPESHFDQYQTDAADLRDKFLPH